MSSSDDENHSQISNPSLSSASFKSGSDRASPEIPEKNDGLDKSGKWLFKLVRL